MKGDVNRYFIELQLKGGPPVPRHRETELRREAAADFINAIGTWLQQNDLRDKVAAMAITALGQVYIACADEVIYQMRDEEDLNILIIRKGAMPTDVPHSWNMAH